MSQAACQVDAVSDPDWERIMELSRAMLSVARDQDWDRVCELQDERFELIRRYFDGGPAAEALEGIRADVSLLLEMDQEVTDLGRTARQKLAKDIKTLRNGRSASRAYRR
jgi:hypothetical protein